MNLFENSEMKFKHVNVQDRERENGLRDQKICSI